MIRLLIDEDSKAKRLVALLQAAGYDVMTTTDFGLDGNPEDSAILRRAYLENRVVLTRNCGDFALLHGAGQAHCGIFMIRSQRKAPMSDEDILRSISNILKAGVSLAGGSFVLNDWQY